MLRDVLLMKTLVVKLFTVAGVNGVNGVNALVAKKKEQESVMNPSQVVEAQVAKVIIMK